MSAFSRAFQVAEPDAPSEVSDEEAPAEEDETAFASPEELAEAEGSAVFSAAASMSQEETIEQSKLMRSALLETTQVRTALREHSSGEVQW